jgi:hypothetical protein
MGALDESYLPEDQTNNHEVRLHHKTEKDFEQSIIAGLRIVREERPDFSTPVVQSVQATGEGDGEAIKAGGIVLVKGRHLRFDAKDSGQGVFFVNASGAETRSGEYPLVLPSSLMAAVPAGLAAGTYEIVVRAAVNGKDVRESRLEGVVVSA